MATNESEIPKEESSASSNSYVSPGEIRNILEKVVNKWATSICMEYKIQPSSFRIQIEQDKGPKYSLYGVPQEHFPPIARVTNGRIVLITLISPWVKFDREVDDFHTVVQRSAKQMKATVRRIFNYISTPELHKDKNLWNPTLISDIMHEYVEGKGTKVWKLKRFDPSIVHGHRNSEFDIEVKISKQVTYIHKETGISFRVVDNNNRPEWDLKQECWIKCSELVELELDRREVERQRSLPVLAWYYHQVVFPTMTDLMVTPESITIDEPKKKSIFSGWKLK